MQVRANLQRAMGRPVALEEVSGMTIAGIKALEEPATATDAAPAVAPAHPPAAEASPLAQKPPRAKKAAAEGAPPQAPGSPDPSAKLPEAELVPGQKLGSPRGSVNGPDTPCDSSEVSPPCSSLACYSDAQMSHPSPIYRRTLQHTRWMWSLLRDAWQPTDSQPVLVSLRPDATLGQLKLNVIGLCFCRRMRPSLSGQAAWTWTCELLDLDPFEQMNSCGLLLNSSDAYVDVAAIAS